MAAGRRAGPIALAALLAFWGTSYAAAYPHTLTFFSTLAGGPSNGYRYLTDSNLDWGQHLELLKRWMDAGKVRHLNLAYFGTADPAYYGIDCTHLPGAPTFALPQVTKPRLPGYVAISATVASGVYLDPRWRLFYRGFRERTPVADIGHSIKVYWVDRWPAAETVESPEDIDAHASLADALLFGLQWRSQAVAHYQAYLTYRPDDARARSNLGLALAALGRFDEAIAAAQRAAAIAPFDAWSRRVLAEVLLNAGRPADAAAEAERAIALSPRDPVVHDVLGVTLVLRGRIDEAIRQFERALALNPDYRPAREHLLRIESLARR
jgi:tetratricopeptide (TPR) repeat protein